LIWASAASARPTRFAQNPANRKDKDARNFLAQAEFDQLGLLGEHIKDHVDGCRWWLDQGKIVATSNLAESYRSPYLKPV
jgi:hypothetical protein